jgi:hypothetical protein
MFFPSEAPQSTLGQMDWNWDFNINNRLNSLTPYLLACDPRPHFEQTKQSLMALDLPGQFELVRQNVSDASSAISESAYSWAEALTNSLPERPSLDIDFSQIGNQVYSITATMNETVRARFNSLEFTDNDAMKMAAVLAISLSAVSYNKSDTIKDAANSALNKTRSMLTFAAPRPTNPPVQVELTDSATPAISASEQKDEKNNNKKKKTKTKATSRTPIVRTKRNRIQTPKAKKGKKKAKR